MRHARAQCYVNVGDGNEYTVIIHNAIKEGSTSAVGECSSKSPSGVWRQASSHRSENHNLVTV